MRTEPTKWDIYYLTIAHAAAQLSKDKNTKVGAVIVGPDREIRATGFNSFPRGINDNVAARQERPLKYKFFEHAERNAIYNAARAGIALKGCSIYVPWTPCCDCARAIIQVGITKVFCEYKHPLRWEDSCGPSLQMLDEAQIPVAYLNFITLPEAP